MTFLELSMQKPKTYCSCKPDSKTGLLACSAQGPDQQLYLWQEAAAQT